MAKKKLTAAERAVDAQMLSMLEWATKHPGWHKIHDRAAAADLLAKRGVVEVWRETGLYRAQGEIIPPTISPPVT